MYITLLLSLSLLSGVAGNLFSKWKSNRLKRNTSLRYVLYLFLNGVIGSLFFFLSYKLASCALHFSFISQYFLSFSKELEEERRKKEEEERKRKERTRRNKTTRRSSKRTTKRTSKSINFILVRTRRPNIY